MTRQFHRAWLTYKMASPSPVNYVAELNNYATRKGERFKDEYTEVGPQVSRTFTCRITLLGKESTGTARSKKEAKILAAKAYLEQVLDVSQLVPSPSVSSPAVAKSPGTKSPATINHKGSLQELLQKNSYRVPEYIHIGRKGPPHDPIFAVKCIVRNGNGDVVKEEYGNAKSKKEAENDAALKMRTFMEQILQSGEPLDQVLQPVNLFPMAAETSQPVLDPIELDELQQRLMSLQCEMAEFEMVESTSDFGKEYLCLASTRPLDLRHAAKACLHYDVASHPVVAHGMAVTEEAAKCDALLSLISNVQALGLSQS